MKFAVGIIVFLWLLCGVIGAWMLDDLDRNHLKEIALGPVTLADAWNAHGSLVPGP